MINEAKIQPDWPRWEEMINVKLKSLEDAHIWNMVECPRNTNIVSCKWVFKIKKNAAGEINKYKACLIVHSFIQQYSVDYDETYIPITHLTSLHLILAIMSQQDWYINVFDFHSMFLDGKLNNNKVIFMELPPGFDKKGWILLPNFALQSTDPNKVHSSDIDN